MARMSELHIEMQEKKKNWKNDPVARFERMWEGIEEYIAENGRNA